MGTKTADRPCMVLSLLEHLSASGIEWVYLRGYESLPADIGNDVDLLVPCGMRAQVAELFRAEAERLGWRELYRAYFGPLAQYFVDPETGQSVHFDLFDRLDWHFLEFADAAKILARRRFNGLVFVPDEGDEVTVNVLAETALPRSDSGAAPTSGG